MTKPANARRAFWDWAVESYANPGVAEACLDLQDAHAQTVPLLLWAAWAVDSGFDLDEAVAAEAADIAQVWATEVVNPLRQIRRRLKTALTPEDTHTRLALREKIKTVELQSERALMTELEQLITGHFPKNNDINHVVKSDLIQAMIRVAPIDTDEALQMAITRLAEALIKS